MQGTSCPVRISMSARTMMASGAISRRLLGASSSWSSAMCSSMLEPRRGAAAVRWNSGGAGRRTGWVMAGSLLVVGARVAGARGNSPCECGGLRHRPLSVGGGEGLDGVLGDQVQAVGGVGEHADAAGFDRQRLGADREVDRGDAELGEPSDLPHAVLRVVPASVG